MPNIALDSGWFFLCLFLGPLVMGRNVKSRTWLFFVISIGLYSLSLKSTGSIIGILIFVLFPFLYISLMERCSMPLWPAVTIILALFVYLNGYLWLTKPFLGKAAFIHIKILGLSYILFRGLDILVQARSRLINKPRFADYINYLFSFWTILAGPIQRYKEFINSLYNVRPLTDKREILKCLHRAANGMLKILILATFFKSISDGAFNSMLISGASFKRLMRIFYSYPPYIYFNFSGYCDVVIAMAKWAGFAVPENFNRPYLSRDMIEFWNRWHITLSQWVRDFVYQPFYKYLISGILSSHIVLAQYASIFITFFLVGIWHGSNFNFVIFGLLQGTGMVTSMLYRDSMHKLLGKERYKKFNENRIVSIAEIVICMHFVCFSFLFFEYDIAKLTLWIKNTFSPYFGWQLK
jgi:D-alanyl-lipoteichoic acid acyltransferase DltB (MBOAT superfamily)